MSGPPIRDLTGQTFGSLFVLRLSNRRNDAGRIMWWCRCLCGEVRELPRDYILRRTTKFCRCHWGESLVGQTFGSLTVIKKSGRKANDGQTGFWICLCICGITTEVTTSNLVLGNTKTCGSFKSRLKHDLYHKTPWHSNFKHRLRQYKLGAIDRGLVFELTEEEALSLLTSNCHYCGREPHQQHTVSNKQYPFIYNGLDRKDNDKGYTKDNTVPCCWPHNQMKGILPYQEFIDLATDIVRHLYLQNKDKG